MGRSIFGGEGGICLESGQNLNQGDRSVLSVLSVPGERAGDVLERARRADPGPSRRCTAWAAS